ncbi:hypothetical protein VCV18_009434 [Metarhizium anisopliae]
MSLKGAKGDQQIEDSTTMTGLTGGNESSASMPTVDVIGASCVHVGHTPTRETSEQEEGDEER